MPTSEVTAAEQTRTDAAVQWVVWHFAELSAVSAPLLLGLTVNGWIAVLSAPAAALWVVFEVRQVRKVRAARPQIASATGTSATATKGTEASA